MVLIDWNKYLRQYKTEVYLFGNKLTEFSWKDCPNSVTCVDLGDNKLKKFSWKDCPNSVTEVYLRSNKLKKFHDIFKYCRDHFSFLPVLQKLLHKK